MRKRPLHSCVRVETLEPLVLMSAGAQDGSDLSEWMATDDGDTAMQTFGGDDEIYAPLGDNTIDGGDGVDTMVIYGGGMDDYQFRRREDGYVEIVGPALNGQTNVNRMINVERINFTDAIVDVASLSVIEYATLSPESNNTVAGTAGTAVAGSSVVAIGTAGTPGTAGTSSMESVPVTPPPALPVQPIPETIPEPIPEPIPETPTSGESTLVVGAGIEAFHRDGQTFLTWAEDTSIDGEQYQIYRHSERITADNLSAAELLTDRWGPLDDDTSVHKTARSGAPTHFVIEDLAAPLDDDTGLFVYTTQQGDSGKAYYAVATLPSGVWQTSVDRIQRLDSAVSETVSQTTAVLADATHSGKGRLYTHYMDYENWNPTLEGYAFNYLVTLPSNYDPSTEYPLKVVLHAYSEGHPFLSETPFGIEEIQIHPDDPGEERGSLHTWWYGFSADHDYRVDGAIPNAGVIENFTEQRVLKAVDEVVAEFNVDTARIAAEGHSMGGSGALGLGIHYGDFFAGIYASQGMTDYQNSTFFLSEFERLWGRVDTNLEIVNDGPHAELITRYNAGGPEATGVWDWLDHGEQLVRRRGEPISYLMFGFGKLDDIIDWKTQGQPFLADVQASSVAYAAELRGDAGHGWLGYDFLVPNLFSGRDFGLGEWQYRNDTSYIAVAGSDFSGPAVPTDFGTDYYNLTIDWATAWNAFDTPIVDTADRYEVTVRSLTSPQTASLTPQNLQQFSVTPGQDVAWQAIDAASGQSVQQGRIQADADGLITLPDVLVSTGRGTRLILTTG